MRVSPFQNHNAVISVLDATGVLPRPHTRLRFTAPSVRVNFPFLPAFWHQLKRLIIGLLLLLGSCTFYDQAVGDGRLPRLNNLSGNSALVRQARYNSTTSGRASASWQALSGSRNLLMAVSPEVALWLYQLHAQNRLEFGQPTGAGLYAQKQEGEALAAYQRMSGKLSIGPGFWSLADGEKTAILAHEYRHARQNWPKQISVQVSQLVASGQLQYESRLEAEAFDYERQVRSALGLSPMQATALP